MIEQINEIKKKLKSNKFIGLGFTNIDDFINIENFLLKNKYPWNGRPDGTCLTELQHRDIRNHSVYCIHINYYGNSALTYATDTTFYSQCDIFLNKDNIDFFKDNLFVDRPTYRPKKIIRELE